MNTRQNVNIFWRKAVLGCSTSTHNENRRVQDLPVVPHGPLTWLLTGWCHVHPSHPKTNCVRNLLQRGRAETSKQRRCVADTAASLRSMFASVDHCTSDHFAKPRSCTVGQRNCLAKWTAMLKFVEEGAQPVDDLRLNTRKPTLRQHKQVCLAMGSMHKTRHQRRITCFGLTLKVGLQSSRMSAKIRCRNRSLQIKVACT